jgi:hypothetical protein
MAGDFIAIGHSMGVAWARFRPMGMEQVVACDRVDFVALLAALAAHGANGMVAMVDGVLQMPGTKVPESWRDVRLRFPAGTLTLARRDGGVAVVVFGNADARLQELQRQISDELSRLATR